MPKTTLPADDYRLVGEELMRRMLNQQLFTFVTAAAVTTPSGVTTPVSGTNNEAERSLRPAALDRRTGRTSKTARGARRRSILASVLESEKLHLPKFTLTTLVNEVARWHDTGQSLFAELLQQSGLTAPTSSLLDQLFPKPT